MQRVDNLRQVMQGEVRYFDDLARQAHERVADIDGLSGSSIGEKNTSSINRRLSGATGGGDRWSVCGCSIIRQKNAVHGC